MEMLNHEAISLGLALRHSDDFGVPSQPANTLPAASTISGTVIERGDSWTCAATSGLKRDLP